MSYDIYLTTPDCSRCKRSGSIIHNTNMTSNVSGIWYRSLMAVIGKTVPENWGSFGGAPRPIAATIDPDGDQWTDNLGAYGPLAGMTGSDAILVLELAAKHINEHLEAYKKFEPDNGWGSAKGAAEFLLRLAESWKAHPEAVLRVSR